MLQRFEDLPAATAESEHALQSSARPLLDRVARQGSFGPSFFFIKVIFLHRVVVVSARQRTWTQPEAFA